MNKLLKNKTIYSERKSPLCYSPFNNVQIDFDGKLTPCCFMKKKYRVPLQPIDCKKDLYYHPFLVEIRNSFLKGFFPKYCEGCSKQKINDIARSVNKRFLDDINSSIIYGINSFNQCNLQCRMCIKDRSTSLSSLYKISQVEKNKYFKSILTPLFSFLEENPENKQIVLSGGEPLIDSNVEMFFQKILPKVKKEFLLIQSNLASNCKIAQKRLELCVKKQCLINTSIDGPPHIHDYIRNSKWEIIQNNIDYIQNNHFLRHVNVVVTALNLEYLPETIEFIKTKIKPKAITLMVPASKNWSIFNLPKELGYSFLNKLQSYSYNNQYFTIVQSFKHYLENEEFNYKDWNTLCQEIYLIDSIQKKNIFNIYPKWKSFFK